MPRFEFKQTNKLFPLHYVHRGKPIKPWQSELWAQVLQGFHKCLWLLATFVATL